MVLRLRNRLLFSQESSKAIDKKMSFFKSICLLIKVRYDQFFNVALNLTSLCSFSEVRTQCLIFKLCLQIALKLIEAK